MDNKESIVENNTPSKSKLPLFFAGILILAVVFIAGYFLATKNQSLLPSPPPKKISQNQFPLTTQSNIPLSSPSETSNWKTYTSTKYGFSIKYPENFSVKEITSQYDDTFSVWFTDQPRDSYPRDLEKGKTDITIVVGGRNFSRQDNYYGGFNWTFPIVRSMSGLANLATNEYGTKIKDTNMGDGNFFGVEYKVTKPTLLDTSLNIALSSDGEGRTFLISGKTGQPNDIFLKPYSDIVDNIFSTMLISSLGPLPTPTPTPKLINYSVDSFKISFSYFENFIPDMQTVYAENAQTGRLVFNKKSDPKKIGEGERDRLIIDVWKNKQPYYQEGFLEREIKLPIGQNIEWPKELAKIANIHVDGKVGVKAQGTTTGRSYGIGTEVGNPCSVLFARIATETDVYEIRSEVSTASPQSVRKEFDDLFDLIISTFKFLD